MKRILDERMKSLRNRGPTESGTRKLRRKIVIMSDIGMSIVMKASILTRVIAKIATTNQEGRAMSTKTRVI